MRSKSLFTRCASVIGLFGFLASNVQAASAVSLLTAREQFLVLQSAGMGGIAVSTFGSRTAATQYSFLSDLEETIRRANAGLDVQSLRRPVSESAVRRLWFRSALHGNFMSPQELRAATDYAHALLRESPRQSLVEKVRKLPAQERNAFHGNVAEFAEARARGLVLTKSRTSPTWDLTEDRFQPRNWQMKVYGQKGRGLSSLLEDFKSMPDLDKRGILTQEDLTWEMSRGRLVPDGNFYRPIGKTGIELHPSKVFARPAESHLYAKTGREGLINRGLSGGRTAPTGFQTAGKWLGRAGIVAVVATEGYVIQGFATGRLSEREFLSAQSVIVGGALGGWGGAIAGAALGGLGGPFAPITVPAGAIIGGIAGSFGGAKLGEMASSSFYARLDKKQKQEIDAYIYRHYGVAH